MPCWMSKEEQDYWQTLSNIGVRILASVNPETALATISIDEAAEAEGMDGKKYREILETEIKNKNPDHYKDVINALGLTPINAQY